MNIKHFENVMYIVFHLIEVRLNKKSSMLAQWRCLFVRPTVCWGKVQLNFKYVDSAWSCVANRINVAEMVHRNPTQVASGENDMS